MAPKEQNFGGAYYCLSPLTLPIWFIFNPLRNQTCLFYIRTECVPCSKHSRLRLHKTNPLRLCKTKVAVCFDFDKKTHIAHLRQKCHNSKFKIFLVIIVQRSVCRRAFKRHSVTTKLANLAAEEYLCHHWTHRKLYHLKTFKSLSWKITHFELWHCCSNWAAYQREHHVKFLNVKLGGT
jgi:hypothetical protein